MTWSCLVPAHPPSTHWSWFRVRQAKPTAEGITISAHSSSSVRTGAMQSPNTAPNPKPQRREITDLTCNHNSAKRVSLLNPIIHGGRAPKLACNWSYKENPKTFTIIPESQHLPGKLL